MEPAEDVKVETYLGWTPDNARTKICWHGHDMTHRHSATSKR